MKTLSLQRLTQPITQTVAVPGSKSYTNRALILASLTEGPVTLLNPLESDDTAAMLDCLQTLGIAITCDGDRWVVEGSIHDIQDKTYHLNARISGTTIRFVLALSCLAPGVQHITGAEGLRKRPIRELVSMLSQLGAEIEYDDAAGYPPLTVTSSSLRPGTIEGYGDISSQYFTAVLMAAPLVGEVTINVSGNQISKPYIDITVDMMEQWGVAVEQLNYTRYHIGAGQHYRMREYTVEGDYSSAAYFFAIAALTGSTITVKNVKPDSVQGDRAFLQMLEAMGAVVTAEPDAVTVHGKGVKPLTVDMEQCPDQAQTLAVLAAFAEGKSVLTGVRSLRVKETERVKAIQTELAKMGIQTESPDEDTLVITGGRPQAAAIDTYGDHRMAMSFAVGGAQMDGLAIRDPQVVDKTFPKFWDKLAELGIQALPGA